MALSTKTQRPSGAHVTTLVSSSNSEAGEPCTNVEIATGENAGFEWEDGGKIISVTPGSTIDCAKIGVGWRLTAVSTSGVDEKMSKIAIEALLDTARSSGHCYELTFLPNNDQRELVSRKDTTILSSESQSVVCAARDTGVVDNLIGLEERPAAVEAQHEATTTAEGAASSKDASREEATTAIDSAEETRMAELRQQLRNGKIVVVYNTYEDEFPIEDGSMKACTVDEEYCLSDAMPGCRIHLSKISAAEFTRLSQPQELGPNFQVNVFFCLCNGSDCNTHSF